MLPNVGVRFQSFRTRQSRDLELKMRIPGQGDRRSGMKAMRIPG